MSLLSCVFFAFLLRAGALDSVPKATPYSSSAQSTADASASPGVDRITLRREQTAQAPQLTSSPVGADASSLGSKPGKLQRKADAAVPSAAATDSPSLLMGGDSGTGEAQLTAAQKKELDQSSQSVHPSMDEPGAGYAGASPWRFVMGKNVFMRHPDGSFSQYNQDGKQVRVPEPGSGATSTAQVNQTGHQTHAQPGDPTPTSVPEPLDPSLSAYETDEFHDNSEYFGPFRLNYIDHTIDLNDWNLVIDTPDEIPGRGNIVVGRHNFIADASNSLVIGKHNTARGKDVTIAGGVDNVAEGNAVAIIGGQENVAKGNYSVVDGGYRNEAAGSYTVASGGTKNVAEGTYAVGSGGENNLADGEGSVVTGGRSNEAVARLSAVHGGSGNKAAGNYSSVGGGLGQTANTRADAIFKELSEEDREVVKAPVGSGQDS